MPKFTCAFFTAALAMALATFMAGTVLAQFKGTGKIICWKDKSGKVVGCGDKVPPEFEDSATKELDRSGMTRKTTETAEEQAKRAAQDTSMAKQKAEEKKRLDEQSRRDSALLNTYATEKEIDQRRDREMQVVEAQITQLRVSHTNAIARLKDAESRIAAAEKAKKPPSDALKGEAEDAAAAMAKLEQNIASKNKDVEDIRARYAQTKQRYMDLRSGAAHSAAAPAAPAKK
jgi:chromosome segregation ATPase